MADGVVLAHVGGVPEAVLTLVAVLAAPRERTRRAAGRTRRAGRAD